MRQTWLKLQGFFGGRAFLTLLSFVYGGALVVKRWWRALIQVSQRIEAPVISVGNLTVGGSGKTTLTGYLAGRLKADGRRVCILTRGYKGGDEAALLRLGVESEGGIEVKIGANRYQSAREFFERVPRAEQDQVAFVMDDGHQHESLQQDFRIVLLDVLDRKEWRRLLPAGLLREPIAWGLQRSDVLILTHADLVDPFSLEAQRQEMGSSAPGVPLFSATIYPTHLSLLGALAHGKTSAIEPLTILQGRKVFLVSGIGNPESFEAMMRRHHLGSVVGHAVLEDHALYDETRCREIELDALRAGAQEIVTTSKDAIKLSVIFSQCPYQVRRWYAIGIRWVFLDGEENFWQLLGQKIFRRDVEFVGKA